MNAGGRDDGPVADLLATGQVRKLVCSFVRADSVAGRLFASRRPGAGDRAARHAGRADPRGGAGVQAFYTPTAADTILAEGRETRMINGRNCACWNIPSSATSR